MKLDTKSLRFIEQLEIIIATLCYISNDNGMVT
jgi:hypothetical protein